MNFLLVEVEKKEREDVDSGLSTGLVWERHKLVVVSVGVNLWDLCAP